MQSTGKDTIVVVGFGWVGQANALALARMGYSVSFYDVVTPKRHYSDEYYSLYEQITPLSTLLEHDGEDTWYIVCIGDRVSEDGAQDISLIAKALDMLRAARGKIILRSTILPTSLAALPFHYYFPEFLHEVYAVEECLNPYYFVLGERVHAPLPDFLETLEKRSRKVFKGTPEQASYIKYLSNVWNAVRIAFVNEFGDTIATPTDDAKRKEIEKIIDFVFDRKSYLRYGKSFGGHCLPKDMRAFIGMVSARTQAPFLTGVYRANELHKQIEEKYQTLPQWFSAWDYTSGRRFVSHMQKWLERVNSSSAVRFLRKQLRPVVRSADKLLPNQSLSDLKSRWNQFASDRPYYYANPDAASGKETDEFELRESGRNDYERIVRADARLSEILSDAKQKRVLDIGAGVGRLVEHAAKDFAEVHGIDISGDMLTIAKKRLAGIPNVTLKESQGNDIPYPDNHFDFIFSVLVFKHLPSPILVQDYLREIERTLRPGGIAKIQLRTGSSVYKWRWFYGVTISPEDVDALAQKAGLHILQKETEGAKNLWVWLKK